MSKDDGASGAADSGFLSRWSRRKAQSRQGDDEPARRVPVTSTPKAASAGAGTASATAAAATLAAATTGSLETDSAAPAPAVNPAAASAATAGERTDTEDPSAEAAPAVRPTLQDVEQLDAASDYRAFVARDVDPQVRNAAFKKLFHSDPHFNVMDGLDVYIDDYNTPNPLPVAVMKTLVQARALGLIDDELKEQELPVPDAPGVVDHREAAPGQVEGEPPAAHDESVAPAIDATVPVMASDADATEPRTGAEVVHVLHLEAANAGADGTLGTPVAAPLSAALSAQTAGSIPAAGPGNVVPFPRRPGSADPA